MLDGTFDAEMNNKEIYSYRGIENNSPVLVYTQPLEQGEHNIEGSVKLTFRKAVIDKNGIKYDLHLLIDNITINTLKETTKPIMILGSYVGFDTLWYKSYSALQEKKCIIIY